MGDNFIKNINILNGIIVYNDFYIDDSIPFKNQSDSFKEDMIQIRFGDRFLLDVGWYPEHDPTGRFVIRAIQDYDWTNPILREECHTLKELKKAIEKTAIFIDSKKRIKIYPLEM